MKKLLCLFLLFAAGRSFAQVIQKASIADFSGQKSAFNPPVNIGRVYYDPATGQLKCIKSDGTSCLNGTGGSGTVSAGTPGQVGFYTATTTIGGDPGFTYSPSIDTINTNLFSTQWPQVDPRAAAYGGCKGDGTDTVTAATACWQAAVNFAAANQGSVWCSGGTTWNVNRITIPIVSGVRIFGPNGYVTNGCVLNANADAIFVPDSITVTPFFASVTIQGLTLQGGQNAIDFPYINDLTLRDLYFRNQTGCAISIVVGQQYQFDHISMGVQFPSFAWLCASDPAKSVFHASLDPALNGVTGMQVSDIYVLGDISTNNSQDWMMWIPGSIDNSVFTRLTFRRAGEVGVMRIGNAYDVIFNNLDLDGIGDVASPEAIGVDIDAFRESSFNSFSASYNNNHHQVTQMYIGISQDSSINNAHFSSAVDDSTTFGLLLGTSVGQSLLLNGFQGCAFSQRLPTSWVTAINSNLCSTSNISPLLNQTQSAEIPNESGTGTALNLIARLTGSTPTRALTAATGTTANLAGIVVANAGKTGSAMVARTGVASCLFDGATTATDFVQLSGTVSGNCHDTGSQTRPTSGWVAGQVMTTNGSGGVYPVIVEAPDSYGTGVGVTSFTGDGTIFNNSASTGGVTATLANTPTGTGGVVLANSPAIVSPTLNGAAIPASAPVVSTNSSRQFVAATVGVAITTGAVARGISMGVVAQNTTQVESFLVNAYVSTLSNINYFVQTADNTANLYDLGLYGPNCTGATTGVPRVVHTGPVAGSTIAPSTGGKTIALAGAPVATAIVPGWYCIALTSSAASPAFILGGENANTNFTQFGAGTVLGATGTTSAGTLNSTVTAPATAITSTTGNSAWVAFY